MWAMGRLEIFCEGKGIPLIWYLQPYLAWDLWEENVHGVLSAAWLSG
jgi:hypothetical protein